MQLIVRNSNSRERSRDLNNWNQEISWMETKMWRNLEKTKRQGKIAGWKGKKNERTQ